MNLLNLSETLNGDDVSLIENRQLSLMLHTGLDDKSLGSLTAGYLPPKNAHIIDKLITDINRNTDTRNVTLTKVNTTISIISFCQTIIIFSWSTQLSARSILSIVPITCGTYSSQLLYCYWRMYLHPFTTCKATCLHCVSIRQPQFGTRIQLRSVNRNCSKNQQKQNNPDNNSIDLSWTISLAICMTSYTISIQSKATRILYSSQIKSKIVAHSDSIYRCVWCGGQSIDVWARRNPCFGYILYANNSVNISGYFPIQYLENLADTHQYLTKFRMSL